LPAAANASTAVATPYVNNPPQCQGGADYGWFCAYSGQNFTGQSIGMYDCGNYPIPWSGIGSYDDELPGIPVTVYFVGGTSPWRLPPAPSHGNIDWTPVASIKIC
jgi:hypothetical protein